MNARSMAFLRVCGGVLASVFALSFAAEKAFAEPPPEPINTVCANLGQYDIGVNHGFPANFCTEIAEPQATIQTAHAADEANVVAVIIHTPLLGGNVELSTDDANIAVFNEAASGEVIYDPADAGMFLYPKDARFPPLPLSALSDIVTVGAGQQNYLVFSGVSLPPPDSEEFAGEQLGGTLFAHAYFSAPAPALECAEGMMLNELMNDCRPTVPNDCTGTDVFHINQCVASCPADFNDDDDDGVCDADIVQQTAPARTESKVRDNAWTAFGGALAVGVLSYLLSDGTLLGYSATPDFGYSLTESGYSYNYGGRVDFHKDRWHLYWTAGQANANGDTSDFRYSSGGKWQGDIFAAAFSEKVQGKTADYDLSLSADYGNGVWKLSPVYRLHSRFEESENGGLESETKNSLNLEGILRTNRWILRPTAGFQWRGMDDFADNAKFGISAMRNL